QRRSSGSLSFVVHEFRLLLEAGALMIFSAVFFGSWLEQLAMLAARHRVPASYQFSRIRLSWGPDELRNKPARTHRQAGVYAGRILKGEKPADLPVVQSTKFEFVINLQTARALGLEVPNSIQLPADEVIE